MEFEEFKEIFGKELDESKKNNAQYQLSLKIIYNDLNHKDLTLEEVKKYSTVFEHGISFGEHLSLVRSIFEK